MHIIWIKSGEPWLAKACPFRLPIKLSTMSHPSISLILPSARLMALLSLYGLLCSCRPVQSDTQPLKGPFFGLVPTDTPQLLAPGWLSTALVEYNGTFNPAGTEFFYTSNVPDRGILTYSKMQADSSWSTPRVAPFASGYTDYDPLFSPDGSQLFFSSRRPVPGAVAEEGPSQIWGVERTDNGWGNPQHIALDVPDAFYSSLTHSGVLYFNSWQTGDMYKAVPSDSGYTVEALPEYFHDQGDAADPFISPEEDYLIYRGYREDRLGRGDMYISFRIQGQWTPPENLGEPINSAAHEMCPAVSPDGKWFIFASSRTQQAFSAQPLDSIARLVKKYQSHDNGQMNLYYMSADFIQQKKALHIRTP